MKDLFDQIKQNEDDFLKNRLEADEHTPLEDEELDCEGPFIAVRAYSEADRESLSDNDLYLDTEEKQAARSRTMAGVAACADCKSATSKIRVWSGLSYYFRCTGCGKKINKEE